MVLRISLYFSSVAAVLYAQYAVVTGVTDIKVGYVNSVLDAYETAKLERRQGTVWSGAGAFVRGLFGWDSSSSSYSDLFQSHPRSHPIHQFQLPMPQVPALFF